MTVETPHGERVDWVKAKKTPEGWMVKESRKSWVPMDKDTQIISKRPISSALAQVPSAGYVQKDTFSKASIQWLEYEMKKSRDRGEPIHIQHALNGGEWMMLGIKYKVDGKSDDTVYEYHGKHRFCFLST